MVILSHKKTGIPYKHISDNTFANLHTGEQGEVSDELANKIFVINVPATAIITENPIIEKLISKLKLKVEPTL